VKDSAAAGIYSEQRDISLGVNEGGYYAGNR